MTLQDLEFFAVYTLWMAVAAWLGVRGGSVIENWCYQLWYRFKARDYEPSVTDELILKTLDDLTAREDDTDDQKGV